MKKLLILTLLLSAAFANAQTSKRVAILDVVDRKDNVDPGVKVMVRGSLTYAVQNMQGYEAYNRADYSSIMDEHSFQRSGNVSDKEIKKMGEMHGVELILVPEVGRFGDNYVTISAQIIDVESAQVIATADPQAFEVNPTKLKEACIQIARTLFKKEESAQNKTFTDLGLPSKTLWKNDNEQGYYTYDVAFSKFGTQLPSKGQFEELINECGWTWTGIGYKVTGPNGNSIFLPAAGAHDGTEVDGVGSYGGYWSSTYDGELDAYNVGFRDDYLGVYYIPRYYGLSVRLVKD